MPLTDIQANKIRQELDNCKNPLFFFHDDPDGLCSFLLLYRYKKEGHGIIVKRATPQVDGQFIPKVHEYNPDKIFILDLAKVDQDFVDAAKVPVIWIDHHKPIKLHNVQIFNPRLNKVPDAAPVTYLCYQVVGQDTWIAAAGCIGDWFIPDFINDFKVKYPDLLRSDSKDPGYILFNTKLGKVSRIMAFILKGKTNNVKKCYKIMTRIKDPYEILEQKTPKGKFIYRKYARIYKDYLGVLEDAKKQVKKDELLVYIYSQNKMSFSGDLANELLHRYTSKLIIVGREKNDEIKMSLRYHKPLLPILRKALTGIKGYGGGHEYACGANISKSDLKIFIGNIRTALKKFSTDL